MKIPLSFSVQLLVAVSLQIASASHAAQSCNPNIPLSTPDSNFTDHGDGTVTHHKTGLMWTKCQLGQSGADCATGSTNVYKWQQALEVADASSIAGYSDWRLPNIKELASIVEMSCYDPAINLSVFPNTAGSDVWSSSPKTEDTTAYAPYVWGLNFYDGANVQKIRDFLKYPVWLVRGGQ